MQTRNRIVGLVMGSAIGMMCVCGGGGADASFGPSPDFEQLG